VVRGNFIVDARWIAVGETARVLFPAGRNDGDGFMAFSSRSGFYIQ
jgi:hypothetical protein